MPAVLSLQHMPKKSTDVTLREWAEKNKVPYRTAIGWANDKKIPAKRRSGLVRVTAVKRVVGYYVPSDARVPAPVKA